MMIVTDMELGQIRISTQLSNELSQILNSTPEKVELFYDTVEFL